MSWAFLRVGKKLNFRKRQKVMRSHTALSIKYDLRSLRGVVACCSHPSNTRQHRPPSDLNPEGWAEVGVSQDSKRFLGNSEVVVLLWWLRGIEGSWRFMVLNA